MTDSFTAKLNELFVTSHRRDEPELTTRQVANAINATAAERGSSGISHVYLWQLRNGSRKNPSKEHIEAIARFFGVPASYFFDDPHDVGRQLRTLRALRSSGVSRVALRAGELDATQLAQLLQILEVLAPSNDRSTRAEGMGD